MGKSICENRKARFDYEIIETFEAGIVLLGSELKPLRMGKLVISDAHVRVDEDELFLHQASIPKYENSTFYNHDENRKRKLLMNKGEIKKLKKWVSEKGFSIIPLKAYFNDKGKVKVLIGVGRGKKAFDKRETIKKRDSELEIKRNSK
jgi:SsrA-binding protein